MSKQTNIQGDDIGEFWDQAVLEYRERTGNDLFDKSQQSKDGRAIDEVLAFASDRQTGFNKWRHDDSKVSKCRSALKSCLGPLDGLGKFVAAHAEPAFPPSTAIFSAMSFMIKVFNKVSADYDKLALFFEDIHFFLDRLKLLDGNVPTPKEIQKCLVDILALVLTIVGISTKNIKEGRGVKFMKKLVSGEDSELADSYTKLKKLVEQEEKLINSQTLVNTSMTLRKLEVLSDIDTKLDEVLHTMKNVEAQLAEMRIENEAAKTADYLPTVKEYFDPQLTDDYARKLPFLIDGTTTWLFEEEAFSGWSDRTTASCPVLWIAGAPGSGKSFISTSVIKRLTDSPEGATAYYYFNHADEMKRTVRNALASMIFQLASKVEVYCMHAAETCGRSVSFGQMSIGSLWRDFFMAHYTNGDKLGEVRRLPHLTLVFDGIDEAEGEQILEFLKAISTTLEGTNIRILLVGRPELTQEVASLGGTTPPGSMVSSVEVSSEKKKADIVKYIKRGFSLYPNLRTPVMAPYQRRIAATLLENSGGMFMWVELMFKAISYATLAAKVMKALQSPPKGLDALYARIFSNIADNLRNDHHAVEGVKQLFCWVGYSRRPLSLRQLEFLIKPTDSGGDSHGHEHMDLEREVSGRFSSLLVLKKKGFALFDEVSSGFKNETEVKQTSDAGIMTTDQGEPGIDDFEVDGDDEDLFADLNDGEDFNFEDLEGESGNVADLSLEEEDEKHIQYQKDVLVELRHASLGDFLRRPNVELSGLLFPPLPARVNIVRSNLQVLTRPDADRDTWDFALESYISNLKAILPDVKQVTDEDVHEIGCYLLKIFFHKGPGQQEIIRRTGNTGLEHLEFGYNAAPNHPSREIIVKWLQEVLSRPGTRGRFRDEELKWMDDVVKAPLKLLNCLTRASFEEMISNSTGMPDIWLYWVFRLAWQCYLSSDQAEPYDGKKERFANDEPEWLIGGSVAHLSNVFNDIEMSVGNHCQLARIMSFACQGADAISEYRKAKNMVTAENEETWRSLLQSTLLSFITQRETDLEGEDIIELCNEYIVQDDSTSSVYSQLGRYLLQTGDTEKGIQAIERALELNPGDTGAAFSYINHLYSGNDYKGICALFERHGNTAGAQWVRKFCGETWFVECLMYAGAAAGKLEIFRSLLEFMMTSKSLPEPTDDDDDYVGVYPAKETSLLCGNWLALLYRKFSGQPDDAFRVWSELIFDDDLLKAGHNTDSRVIDEIIPRACEQFAELIFDKAATAAYRDNAEQAQVYVTMMERLHRLQAVSESLQEYWQSYSQKNLNLLLARLYLKFERTADALPLVKEQFKRCPCTAKRLKPRLRCCCGKQIA